MPSSHLLPTTPDLTRNPDVTKAKQRFGIIGNSPLLLSAIQRAVTVAPIDLSVLITGESGSGKEFFPKIIHNFGARKHKKFIAVNCGAIPEGTIDSELFGHEKGSFTGAVSDRKGYFEEADGGTIFLDEVAELPLTTQARLLRVLETGEYLRVGSSQTRKTNIRVVAATNVDLLQAVDKGKFRQDLYYRLSTVVINVPNLHDRGDDVFLLARKFAADFSEKYLTAPISFDERARHAMALYQWPGNVRQLKNIVEQLALFHAGSIITREVMIDMLPPIGSPHAVSTISKHDYETEREMLWQTVLALKTEIETLRQRLDNIPETDLSTLREGMLTLPHLQDSGTHNPFTPYTEEPATIQDSEKAAIVSALEHHNGNRRLAAESLGISTRTLYRKIREFNIE